MSRLAKIHPGNTDLTVKELVAAQPVFMEITTPSDTATILEIKHGLGRVPNGLFPLRGWDSVAMIEWTPVNGFIGTLDFTWTKESMYALFSVTDATLQIMIV